MSVAPFTGPPVVCELHDITLKAGGRGRQLCTALSLRFAPGERWVILGPNGAGKSTLIATLAGLLPAARGHILLNDMPLGRIPPSLLARHRSWCPQFWHDPFPTSARETVACAIEATQPTLAAEDIQRLACYWLDRFDMAPLANTDVRMLSGGERQRVALATALAQSAPLLLLDEPTAHLDWSHQALLRTLLMACSAAGATLITAVHDLNLAWSVATHALLLDGQGSVCWGTRDEVLTDIRLSHAYGVKVICHTEHGVRWFRLALDAHGDRYP